jgi:hypothetical protein
MKSKSLVWFVAGVLLLSLCVAAVNATCTLDSVEQTGNSPDTVLLGGMGVTISGSCNAGETNVYLWMSGSNPMAPYLNILVNGDGTWSAWWIPQCLSTITDAGNYFLYASTSPPPTGSYATHSVVLEKNPTNGDIVVTTNPSGANFYLDNPSGYTITCYSTPCEYFNIIPGAHNVRVGKYLYNDASEDVTVSAGSTTLAPLLTLIHKPPTVTSITLTSGPSIGGTKVTIIGDWLEDATGVKFGATDATFTHNYDHSLTATAPAHAGGVVDVTVTTPGGTSAVVAGDQFTYLTGRPAAIAYAIDKDFGGDPAKPENKEKELQVSDTLLPANTVLNLGNGQTCPSVAYDAWVDTTNNDKNANLGSTVPPAPKQFTNTFYADGKDPVVCSSDFPPIEIAMSHAAGNIPNSGGWTDINYPPAPDPQCQNPVATNNYALLISGGGTKETNYNRYYNDIKFLYKTLINDYHYDPTHIKVLMSDGLGDAADQVVINNDGSKSYINSEQNLDGVGGDDVNGAADYANISTVLGTTWRGLPSTATLLIFTTGHGAQVDTIDAATNANQVNLLLWQAPPYSSTEKITDAQFASLLPANPKIILVMEQCYGGGFKNNVIISGKTRTLAAAALGSQQSHSNDFSYPWITGASWHDSANNPANADLSTVDGLIQTLEAFNFAQGHDPSFGAGTETPTNNPIGTGANALTLVTCGSGKSITFSAKTPTPWVAGSSGTVTWTTQGLTGLGQNVKIDIMKGAGAGVWQATFYPQTGDAAKSVTIGTATKNVPTVMTTGGDANDYWLKISTVGTLRPPVIGTSGTFQITGVTAGSLATLKIGNDSSNKRSLITIIDNSNGQEVQPGQSTYHEFSLPGGSYTITLSRSCTIPMVPQTITLGSGEVKPTSGYLTYPLTDVPPNDCPNGIVTAGFGSIDITSLPDDGYHVYLKPASAPDTQYQDMGIDTPTIWNVLPGDWTVKLEATGYIPGVQNVQVVGGDTVEADFVLQPDTQPPSITTIGATPNPAAITNHIIVTAIIDDTVAGSYIKSAKYSLDNGQWVSMNAADGAFDSTRENVMATLPLFTTTGVYDLKIQATDAAGNTVVSSEEIMLVVYDPNGGFVTGGGWINSPLTAYAANPSLIGKATFGFVSKYVKGKTLPTGDTEFQFQTGNLKFQSTSYDWLVVAGTKAQYKGSGTINGAGNYGFMLTATDGSPDKFRIKIWDIGTGNVVYDNQMGASDDAILTTAIAGGSIVVHKT